MFDLFKCRLIWSSEKANVRYRSIFDLPAVMALDWQFYNADNIIAIDKRRLRASGA